MTAKEEDVPLALVGLLSVLAAFAIFLIWTLPVNRDTVNWTAPPAEWPAARDRWEYSHVGGAVCLLIGLIAVTLAAI